MSKPKTSDSKARYLRIELSRPDVLKINSPKPSTLSNISWLQVSFEIILGVNYLDTCIYTTQVYGEQHKINIMEVLPLRFHRGFPVLKREDGDVVIALSRP